MTVPVAPDPSRPSAAVQTGGWLVVLVVSLFFIWGSATSLNDILIPKLKGLFRLSYTDSMLIQFAFFGAYFVVSVPAGAWVARLGYGKGIVLGLAVMAAGCLMFLPAASMGVYGLFLAALFVLAGGITILQVAANPLIANLGDPANASSRLTLAQAFNSFGTTIAPFIGAQLILAPLASGRAAPASVIGHAYFGIAIALALVAIVFWRVRKGLGDASAAASLADSFSLMRRPRLALGVGAIFIYVGAEVAIGSLMVNYLVQPSTLGLDPALAGQHLAFYWGGAMVGRFVGSVVLRLGSPGKILAGAAVGAGALVLVSAFSHGDLAGWTLLSVGLMNAIMFPTIFSLALEGLGEKTPEGSGLLCMAIVGGAVVPLITGKVADLAGLSMALLVPTACYALIAGYGWFARKPAEEAK
jgi:MFS transporter, FHS family, L-fucose permease